LPAYKGLAWPGLQLYGFSQKETLAAARKLTAVLLYEDNCRDQRILSSYPGRTSPGADDRSLCNRPSPDSFMLFLLTAD
jgi:hypothetical protein